jgi:preprotein translocase subunit YajC
MTGKDKTMPDVVDLTSSVLLAQNGAPDQPGMPSLLGPLLPFIMIAVLFYFLMIRPERRKRQDLAVMLQNLKKNDRVVTIGGIYGTVVTAQKDSDEITLKVDENSNTKLRMQRNAIARVLTGEGSSMEKGA